MFDENENPSEQAKEWIQENLRIVVSVFIVFAVAVGIYTYSQRSSEYIEEQQEYRDYQPSKQDCYRDYGDLKNVNDVPVKCKWYFED